MLQQPDKAEPYGAACWGRWQVSLQGRAWQSRAQGELGVKGRRRHRMSLATGDTLNFSKKIFITMQRVFYRRYVPEEVSFQREVREDLPEGCLELRWMTGSCSGPWCTFQAKETPYIKTESERGGMFGHCLVTLQFIIKS